MTNKTLRHFIRESISESRSDNQINEILLPVIFQIIKDKYFTEEDEDPCVNFERLLKTEDLTDLAKLLAGIGLAFIPLTWSAGATAAALESGVVAAKAGQILSSMTQFGLAGFIAYGGYVTGDQLYSLYFYTTTSADKIGISEFERNRICSELLGNLFIAFCLSRIAGRTVKGSEIKELMLSDKSKLGFIEFLQKSFKPFSTPARDMVFLITSFLAGTRFDDIYESTALSNLRKLQPENLYEIDGELASMLFANLEEETISATFSTSEIARGILLKKIKEMCSSTATAVEKREEIKKAYEELKKILQA